MTLGNDWTECYAVPGERGIIDAINPLTGLTYVLRATEEEVKARHPGAVRTTWDQWRGEQASKQQTPIVWEPTTEERYYEMLGVLPPIEWRGGAFMVSEPADSCYATGRPRYQAFRQTGDEYFAASRPMTRAELRAIIK